MEWLTGLFTLLGVSLGIGIGELRRWQERKERFQLMTFEKRLETHQAAYFWFYSLYQALAAADKDAEEIHELPGQGFDPAQLRGWIESVQADFTAPRRCFFVGQSRDSAAKQTAHLIGGNFMNLSHHSAHAGPRYIAASHGASRKTCSTGFPKASRWARLLSVAPI